MTSPTYVAPIVVGVDGSPSSVQALRHAAQLAEPLDTSLLVVTCWSVPQLYSDYIDMDSHAFQRDAQDRQDAAVTQAFGGDCPVLMSTSLQHGRPAPELIATSEGARLLVVGTRGHGQFVNMILGSVSLECIAQATCPVLTVRVN